MGKILSKTMTLYISLLASTCVYSQQVILVKDDNGTGVLSEITISLGESTTPLGPTDDKGMMPLGERCTRGQQINATPEDPTYYPGGRYCSPDSDSLPVKVTKKAFAENLEKNAKYYESAEQWGNAALAYNELAERLAIAEPDRAAMARSKVFENFARAVKTPEDITVIARYDENNKNVMTSAFKKFLETVQGSTGLKVTGKLDFQTLDSKASRSVMQMMTESAGKK